MSRSSANDGETRPTSARSAANRPMEPSKGLVVRSWFKV
jgi:hypothetical protein